MPNLTRAWWPWRLLVLILRTIPFSLLMVVAILATAAVTNSLGHPISATALQRWGFGFEQLRDGRFHNLFTAPFQIFRPHMAISISAMILLFVGTCEYRLGTWRAVAAFLVGHIVGYVGGILLLALMGQMGWAWAMNAALTTDVGASNGAFGAAGAVLLFIGGRARKVTFMLISVYLVSVLLVERKNWDVAHILAFAAGLTLGRFYLSRMGRLWPGLLPRWQIERRQHPVVVTWVMSVIGAVNILSAFLLPHHAGFARLEALVPIGGPHWPRHLLLVTGLVLLVLVPGLARRQRAAWWGALCALTLSLLVHLQVAMNPIEVTLAGAFILMLLAWRSEFRAPTHAPSMRSGLLLLASLVAAVPLYGLVGFYILRIRFDEPVTVAGAFTETLARVLFAPQTVLTNARPAQWFLDSIPLVAWFGVILAVARIIRSSFAPAVSPDDLANAKLLLKDYGNTGTSYMTLWKGNSLFFGSAQQCYVAYRVNSGVAVALGDPIGPPGACAETIRSFTEHADKHGWTPVFYATTSALLEAYRDAGYEPLQIGEEAIISLPQLEFRGKEWQNVRSAINRAERTGVKFQMLEGGTIPPELRAQLFEISAEWSAGQELPAMGFTLGTTDDVDDPNVNVGIAIDASMRIHAYVDWLPVYGRRGWVIDLMRRREDAMNGVMDFLIASSLKALQERGYETASLATAPLADLDRGEAPSLLHWLLGIVYERSQKFYDFRSLFQYKEKFQPNWESTYLMHRGLTTLPAVVAALTRAYLPDLGLAQATLLLGESAARSLLPGDAVPD